MYLPALSDFLRNPSFWSAFGAWFTAQIVKVFIHYATTRRIDFRYLVSLGGMPSAHSATVSAIAFSVGLNVGFNSQLFMSMFVMALIVMFDASTVRRAAGRQASILNGILDELFKEHHFAREKLVELLGHTRLEVFVGLLMGVLVALIVNGWWAGSGI